MSDQKTPPSTNSPSPRIRDHFGPSFAALAVTVFVAMQMAVGMSPVESDAAILVFLGGPAVTSFGLLVLGNRSYLKAEKRRYAASSH